VLLLFRAFYYFAHAKSWLRQNAHRDVIHAKMHSPTWCHLYFTHIYYFISFNWFYHFSMTKMSLSLFSSSHGDDSHGGSHHTLCHFSAPPCPRTSEMHRRMHAVAAHTLPPRSCHARVPLLRAVAVRLTRLQSGGGCRRARARWWRRHLGERTSRGRPRPRGDEHACSLDRCDLGVRKMVRGNLVISGS
jgi:hypothetical protein